MVKKIFKAVTVFSLLVGCYLAYVQVFAVVVRQMTTSRRTANDRELVPRPSNSKHESIELAKAVMPPGHWSTRKDLNFRYYSAEHGYWMYAEDMEQVQEENGVRYDGKRIRLSPFLAISTSRDRKKAQTITSDRAVIDLNQALGFSAGTDGEALKVKHVRWEPNVVLHDNKGTPNNPKDDMTIGPLTNLEYDEPTQQMTTDSHVVIEDAEMITTGDGMLVQLGKNDASGTGGSSGFNGVERLELFKNVHVVVLDVGKSGLMPGMSEPQQPPKRAIEAKIKIAGGPNQKAQTSPAEEPTPLNLTCDSKMRVFPARTRLPVRIGPPDPPAPTIVQFDRNVVVLRGKADSQPGQLTCDNLKLTLIPAEEPPSRPDRSETQNPETATMMPTSKTSSPPVTTKTPSEHNTLAKADASPGEGMENGNNAGSPDKPATGEKDGLFGSLTLERAHATGHAVWLYLPLDGVKLKCNELIYMRRAPEKPNLTYFRGDVTRPLVIEKIDVVQDLKSPDRGKVKSVTHIWTIDATMYDKGRGFGSADIVANGPGRLETQPDRGQPVERTAIWQDKLEVQNDVAPDGTIKQKTILLTGERPCFIDNSRGSSIDSAQSIKVLLVPKLPQSPKEAPTQAEAQTPEDSSLGGGGFDLKRLLAYRDVHLLATRKTMTARKFLDAEFEQKPMATPPVASTSAAPANAENVADQTAPNATPVENQVSAKEVAPTTPLEPLMVGSAERIWVKIEMTPKPPAQTVAGDENAETKTVSTTGSKSKSSESDLGDKQSEIREAWLWGSVAIHQDPAEGKTKGQDASGETLYLDNRGGKDKAITLIYQREPNETKTLPGPLPPAHVENDKKTITASGGAGIIAMNQATDQAWVEGPGTLSQLSTRTASSPAVAPTATPKTTTSPPSLRTTAAPAIVKPHATLMVAQNEPQSQPGDPQPATTKPTTRAGRPMSEEVSSVICFSEQMEFNGKSVDPEGHPAGRADFYGVTTAQLEDSLLHAEEAMIAYTDRPVPFAQLGALNKPKSNDAKVADDQADSSKTAEDDPQLSIIECYRNAVGISRKVDPDHPEVLQQQRIEADELLVYDRRTGNFHIPGRGKVYLYDRSDNSQAQGGTNPTGGNAPPPQPVATTRTVASASSRSSSRTARTTAPPSTRGQNSNQTQPSATPDDPKKDELPSLVLTQIHFVKGMRGRFGSTSERDQTEPHWYQFFGNVELLRAKVSSTKSRLNFDNRPADGLFLTGQTLSVRTEPPPASSSPSTPGRDYVKAWENAYVYSSDKYLQADVITYDSEKDLVYAFGEGGRPVIYAQQIASGQPSTQGSAKAVRFNPKTGAAHFIENAAVQFVDNDSGARPQAATLEDPDFKKKKRPKKGFRIMTSNVERRGFTGQ